MQSSRIAYPGATVMLIVGLIIVGLIVLLLLAALADVLWWTHRRRRDVRAAWSANEAMYQRQAQLTHGRKTGLTVIVRQIEEREGGSDKDQPAPRR